MKSRASAEPEPNGSFGFHSAAGFAGDSVVITFSATPNAAGLVRFNPFTTAPIECTAFSGSAADQKAACIAQGANWKKSAQFGQPTSGSSSAPSFQAPRTYLVTVGARF